MYRRQKSTKSLRAVPVPAGLLTVMQFYVIIVYDKPEFDERRINLKKVLLAVLATSALGIAIKRCVHRSLVSDKDTIGIIGAMDSEIDTLKQAAKQKSATNIAGMEFVEGKLRGRSVVIVKCGVGKVNAGICADLLINHFGCGRVINTGVAGSLNNDIDIGDIVVSVDAVQHDLDATALGFEKGQIPFTDMRIYTADKSLRQAAVRAVKESAPEINVFEGRICSGDQFISTPEQKEKIIADFNGMCCEMEGGAIAQACCLSNTPFVIIRAISDKSDGSQHIEFETFQAEAARNCANIVEYMIEKM